jgi:alkaline phosphatase D
MIYKIGMSSTTSRQSIGLERADSSSDGRRPQTRVDIRPLAVAVDPAEVEEALASRPAGRDVDPETVFPQSVASGDPSERGAIVWTRVDPATYDPEEHLYVEVAEDESFEGGDRLVVTAGTIRPEDDYTVKVNLDESAVDLAAGRHYFYRFEYGGVTSRTGRFRTLPAADTSPERVRFAVITCQNYLNGYFGAHAHIAREDIDFILDLGDFIYEYTGDVDPATGASYEGRSIKLAEGQTVAQTLNDYRRIYRRYHEDPYLQASLERHARIHIWDDHEFANDIYWDNDLGAPVAPDHPLGDDPVRMHGLVRDALKAWWEYTPIRIETFDPEATDPRDVFTVKRSFQFGDLLNLVLTDERLRKTKPTSNCTRSRLPDWLPVPLCYVSRDPDETMLGEKQREWFVDEVVRPRTAAEPKPKTTWTAWGNQVLTLPARIGLGPFSAYASHQAWDGYEAEREWLMYRIKEGLNRGELSNFVTLTGDMHSYLVGIQRLDYPSVFQTLLTDPSDAEERSRRVGVELMTPALTSINFAEKFAEIIGEKLDLDIDSRPLGTMAARFVARATERLMPHIEYFGSRRWGYSVVEFSADRCLHWTYEVDKTVDSPTARRELIRAVEIQDGSIDVEDVTETWRDGDRSEIDVSWDDTGRPTAPTA